MLHGRRVVLAALVISGLMPFGRAPASEAPPDPHVETGILEATAAQNVLVRFEQRVPAAVRTLPGLEVHYEFESLPAMYATASPAAVRALAAREDLAYLEADKPIEFDLDTATKASRSYDVVHPDFDPDTPALLDGDGNPIDGRGVGIAIVDTGLDGLHPDYQAPGKVGGNFFMTPAGPVPAPITSLTTLEAAHGTHVAGIAAGTGALSAESPGPVYEGVAPGATLYSFNVFYGAGSSALPAMAFDWIIRNGAAQDPPIRVVNNSWHCSGVICYASGSPLHMQLATELAKNGFVVTWAAGNDKGDGVFPTTSVEARNQTSGIISVANYKDEEAGRRDLCLSSNSAWGASGDPTTWPDLSAPGRSITSTWAFGPHRSGTSQFVYRDPITNANAYRSFTGTSMAAPHVAGIVALLLQANPDLTPAEVEYLLKQTATELIGPPVEEGCGLDYVRADPNHPWHGANYVAGHGLVHAYDAVVLAHDFGGIPAQVDNEPLPADFVIARPGIEVDHTLYLAGDDGLQTAYPEATAPRTAPMAPNTGLVFTSDPLGETIEADSVKVDVYIGTNGEAVANFTPPRIRVTVERVDQAENATIIASDADAYWQIHPLAPTQRDFAFMLDTPVILGPQDRVRATVEVISPPLSGVDPPPEAFWILYWERPFTSRVSFGNVVARPAVDSRAGCESRQDCADLDAEHEFESMTCGATTYTLTWYGPPGSSLIFWCETGASGCVVPGMPGEKWGTCEVEYDATVPRLTKGGFCTYRMPDGTRGGKGRCVGRDVIEDDD